MACPLPVYMRFVAPVFGALSRPRTDPATGGLIAPGGIRFESLSGDAELSGFSPYRATGNTLDEADPDAPWNQAKYLRRSLSGFLRREQFMEDGELICYLPASFPYPSAGSYGESWSGIVTVDAATATVSLSGARTPRDYGVIPNVGACSITSGAPAAATDIYGGAGGYNSIDTATETTRMRTGSGVSYPIPESTVQWASQNESGVAVETLSAPDSAFAALARAGGAVAGTLRETLPGEFGSAAPGSLGVLPFTDTTGVRALAAYTGLSLSTTYTARVWLHLRGLDGRDNSSASADFEYTPTASICEVPYDLPVMPGYAVSLVQFLLFPL